MLNFRDWWERGKERAQQKDEQYAEEERLDNAQQGMNMLEIFATPAEALEAARLTITRASTSLTDKKYSLPWCGKAISAIMYLEKELEGGKDENVINNTAVPCIADCQRNGDIAV